MEAILSERCLIEAILWYLLLLLSGLKVFDLLCSVNYKELLLGAYFA